MITKNKFVTVTYELRTNKGGDTVEVADAEHPLEFICGQGQTLEYFEMNLLGLNEGDDFDFNRNNTCVLWISKNISYERNFILSAKYC